MGGDPDPRPAARFPRLDGSSSSGRSAVITGLALLLIVDVRGAAFYTAWTLIGLALVSEGAATMVALTALTPRPRRVTRSQSGRSKCTTAAQSASRRRARMVPARPGSSLRGCAQAGDRVADDARGLHLRDADASADLPLGELLLEAQAQHLALARRDRAQQQGERRAVLGQPEARLGAGERVAERVAGTVLAGARGLQRRRAVGTGGRSASSTCSSVTAAACAISATVGWRCRSLDSSTTCLSTRRASSCRPRGTRTDHVRSRR